VIMIGGGPMEQEVRQAADAKGFGKFVTLAGRKNAAQISEYMRAANLLAMSSENEGVPNVILEAFASGLPVVSTNVGGISEVVNQPFLGTLVERGNAVQLQRALVQTLREPPSVEKIRSHGLHFSWERAGNQYLEVLRRAVTGS
jgi:teichuronic acid biosynthesis glycosyltransferase TuaC